MFFDEKTCLLLIILLITENIFAFNLIVQKYFVFNKQRFATNHSSLNTFKSLNTRDLLTCLMACTDTSNCNAIEKRMNDCLLIKISSDASLI